jgi:hypothetical protein
MNRTKATTLTILALLYWLLAIIVKDFILMLFGCLAYMFNPSESNFNEMMDRISEYFNLGVEK